MRKVRPWQRSVPGGIRLRLALVLFVMVGGALGAAYAVVVPSLERRLVDAKFDQIEQTLAASAAPGASGWDEYAVDLSFQLAGSRVTVFRIRDRSPLRLRTIADSQLLGIEPAISPGPVALDAARTYGIIPRGRVAREGGEYGEVATQLANNRVVLISAPLADTLGTVTLVKRQLLAATVVAVITALSLGLVAAAIHARRIRRLERVANRIAQGRFDEPVGGGGGDEVGELAAAFERMREQLAQLDTARKEFVANASHELRTPLFSLAGFLELMADEDLDEATRQGFLITMREQVERLTRLTADLLDLSRLDAGRFRVEREDVELCDLARVLVDEMRGLAEHRGDVLEIVEGDEVWAVADEERVLQVGRALVANGILHTPVGTVVRVGVSSGRAGATLTVADNGPGIPQRYQERIFDRFYRVEGGQASSGSGLGLAIARELAQQMGGAVHVRSVPGETVFSLVLPAVLSEPRLAVA